MEKVTEFVTGEVHKVAFVIEGEVYPVSIYYTGRGQTFDGVKLGEFQNATKKEKTYLLSLEGLQRMQGEPFESEVFGE